MKDYPYYAVIPLHIRNSAGNDKDAWNRELASKSGQPSFFKPHNRIYADKERAMAAARDERAGQDYDRKLSRCSYLWSVKVVVKACNEYGEFPKMPRSEIWSDQEPYKANVIGE
jgi:hypothetical protein